MTGLIVSNYGMPETGKTCWAIETSPQPVRHFNFDKPLYNLQAKWEKMKLKVRSTRYVASKSLRQQSGKLNTPSENMAIFGPILASFLKDYSAFLKGPEKTGVLDTGDALYELIRFASFGKLKGVSSFKYDEPKRLFKSLLDDALRADKLLFVIHKMKKKYVKIKSAEGDDSAWTGEYVKAGVDGFSYLVPVEVENLFDRENKTFGIRIERCIYDVAIVEETLWNTSFKELMDTIYPEWQE